METTKHKIELPLPKKGDVFNLLDHKMKVISIDNGKESDNLRIKMKCTCCSDYYSFKLEGYYIHIAELIWASQVIGGHYRFTK